MQWDETELGKPFTDIHLSNDTAFFTFMGGDAIVAPQLLAPIDVYTTGFTACWTSVWQQTSESQGYYITVFDDLGNVVVDEQWVMDTTYAVNGLLPDTEYTYLVKAAYIVGDNIVKQASALDKVTTLQDKGSEHLDIFYKSEENTLYIVKNDAAKPLYVYDIAGRIVYENTTVNNLIRLDVSNLLIGQAYIFQSGGRSAKWINIR